MKATVEFLHDCADDRRGEVKAIDAKRARRLAWTGYVRVLDGPETAMVEPEENAMRPGGQARRRERRG